MSQENHMEQDKELALASYAQNAALPHIIPKEAALRVAKAMLANLENDRSLLSVDVHVQDLAEVQALVAKLQAQKAMLYEALENLRDEQNGPPLLRRSHLWQVAYDQANYALAAAK